MVPTVEVDNEVWEQLKADAEPFVDTPNSVLRRLLNLGEEEHGEAGAPEPSGRTDGEGTSAPRRRARSRSGRKRSKQPRAPMGSLLPESEYELPILRVLADHGGRAAAREVVAAVGKIVDDKLTELDREELPNGGKRWENRVQFTRLRLKERGLIESGSPRGLWELSDAGRTVLSGNGAS